MTYLLGERKSSLYSLTADDHNNSPRHFSRYIYFQLRSSTCLPHPTKLSSLSLLLEVSEVDLLSAPAWEMSSSGPSYHEDWT